MVGSFCEWFVRQKPETRLINSCACELLNCYSDLAFCYKEGLKSPVILSIWYSLLKQRFTKGRKAPICQMWAKWVVKKAYSKIEMTVCQYFYLLTVCLFKSKVYKRPHGSDLLNPSLQKYMLRVIDFMIKRVDSCQSKKNDFIWISLKKKEKEKKKKRSLPSNC